MPATALLLLIKGKLVFVMIVWIRWNDFLEHVFHPKKDFSVRFKKQNFSKVTMKYSKCLKSSWVSEPYGLIVTLCKSGCCSRLWFAPIEWRDILKAQWRLDIVKYVSLPGFAHEFFLLKRQQELEVLSATRHISPHSNKIRGGWGGGLHKCCASFCTYH